LSSKSAIQFLTGIVMLLVCIVEVHAAFEQDLTGPRSLGMGGAGIALISDGWGGLRNPALIHGIGSSAATSWSQQFGLPELNLECFSVSGSSKFANFGINGSTFGSELYRETSADIAMARALRPNLVAGVAFGVRSLSVRDYGNGSAPCVTVGLLAAPTDLVKIGVVWRNLNRAYIEGYQDRLPESLTLGASSEVGEYSRVVFDLVAEKHFPVESRFGIESRLMKNLELRIGGRAEPFRPSCGIGIGFNGMWFHYSGDLHSDLGASHSVGLEFHPDK
jgi:hypothetical protein